MFPLSLPPPSVILVLPIRVRGGSTAGDGSSLSVPILPPPPLVLLVLLLSQGLVLPSPPLPLLLLRLQLLFLEFLPDFINTFRHLSVIDVETEDVPVRFEVLALLQAVRGLDHLRVVPGPGADHAEGDDQEGREEPDSDHSGICDQCSHSAPHTDWPLLLRSHI